MPRFRRGGGRTAASAACKVDEPRLPCGTFVSRVLCSRRNVIRQSTYGSCRDENTTATAPLLPAAATWNVATSSAVMLEEGTGPKINTMPVHAEAEAKPDEGRSVVWAQFRTPSIFDLSQSVFFVTVTRQT